VNLSVKDPVLARTLLDLSQTATINDSLKLGKAVLGELGDVNSLHKQSVEQAGFAVLKSPDVPSILVETAFISNPEEERRLKDGAYQDKARHRDPGRHQALPRAEPAARPQQARPEINRVRPCFFAQAKKHGLTLFISTGDELDLAHLQRLGGLRLEHGRGLERGHRAGGKQVALEGFAVVGAQEVQLRARLDPPRR